MIVFLLISFLLSIIDLKAIESLLVNLDVD